MNESTCWYERNDEFTAQRAFEYADALDRARSAVMESASTNYRLYDGRGELIGRSRLSPLRPAADYTSENVVKSAVDTAMALVGRAQPRIAVLTDNANFSTHRKARLLEKFVEGVFQAEHAYRKFRLAFRGGCISGTGLMKITPDYARGRPRLERVLIDELLVDEHAARDGKPREAMQRYPVDRGKLAAAFPDYREKILAAPVPDFPLSDGRHPAVERQVEVIECWHLPSDPDADDGIHALCVPGCVLSWEPWIRDEIPFVRWCWTEPELGYYGTSLVEEIAGIQLRLIKYNKDLDEIIDRNAFPRTWIHKADLNAFQVIQKADMGFVGAYQDQPPVTEAPRVVPPDIVNRMDRLHQMAFRLSGIGEMAAHAKKPADIRSGIALREFSDIESMRLVIQGLDNEDGILEVGRHVIAVAKEMAEADGYPSVTWRSRNLAKQIDWADVDLEEDIYSLKVEAASVLSRTPAGRKDMVVDLLSAGVPLSPPQIFKLLDLPDVEQESELEQAELQDADATIERLENGENVQPDPFQNLELVVSRSKKNYLRIRHMKGITENALQAHRDFVKLATDALAERAQSMTAQIPAPAPGPVGSPDSQAPGPGFLADLGMA